MVSIRPAERQDARAICSVIQLALGDDVQQSHVQGVIAENAVSEGDRLTLVAANDEPVGFVDGFITTAAAGSLRWELDLLGVHPAQRGQSLGRQLVMAFYDAGRSSGASVCRALVAVDNVAMHHVMRACDFRRVSTTCHLYVTEDLRADCEVDLPHDGHLVPVKTLTYSGIWVEPPITKMAVDCAKQRAAAWEMDVVGCVVAESDRRTIHILSDLDFTLIDQYHWWERKY